MHVPAAFIFDYGSDCFNFCCLMSLMCSFDYSQGLSGLIVVRPTREVGLGG